MKQVLEQCSPQKAAFFSSFCISNWHCFVNGSYKPRVSPCKGDQGNVYWSIQFTIHETLIYHYVAIEGYRSFN
jgi:hypothetical protein